MALSKEITLLRDYEDEANLLRESYGRTDMFSTGAPRLDKYLGGGFGRTNGYEIVLLFGPTKIGKSMVGLNFLRAAVEQRKKVAILALEDDGADVFLRFTGILGDEATEAYIRKGENVHMMPRGSTQKPWKLEELLELIESYFVGEDVDLILLDHLQFAFENAEMLRGENEFIMQRVFMQRLNHLMKRVKKTIILVSHINKSSVAKGSNRVIGSSGIAAAATKILEVSKTDGRMFIQEHGARFVRTPEEPHEIMFDNMQLRDAEYGIPFD